MPDEDVGPCLGFGTMCAAICCFLPLSTLLVGWNEKSSVCRQWALEKGADNAHVMTLDSFKKDKNGKTVMDGDLVFVTGPLDQTKFQAFTEKNIDPYFSQMTLLFGKGGTKATAIETTVQMWQCEEFCSKTEQHCTPAAAYATEPRLFNLTSYRNFTTSEVEVKAEEGFAAVTEERQLLSKRALDGASSVFRRLKKDQPKQKCETVCVEWGYKKVLSTSKLDTSSFHDTGKARQAGACGSNYNPGFPSVGLGTKRKNAPAATVQTQGSEWQLNSVQVNKLPAEANVALVGRTGARPPATPDPTRVLTPSNTVVSSQDGRSTLNSCNAGANNVGCLVIYFMKAVPPKIAMLGKMDSTGTTGELSPDGWQAPGYWLCSKGASENNIERFCPQLGGKWSCTSSSYSLEGMIQDLKSANSFYTLMIRILGFLAFWCSVSACLQPIRSVLGLMANMADGATDCIPCVGSCVDLLTDIFMGVVKTILCIVSFCCGGAMFLTVVVVMWIVMKPWLGIPLCCVSCCCWAGAGYLLHTNRRSMKGGEAREMNTEMGGSFQG